MKSNNIWFAPFDVSEINERAKNTLSDHLGIVFTEKGDDYLAATMPVDARTIQPMGILHGGASCALAETIGSAAANYCIDQKKQVCVGVDININHIRPVNSGTITAIAKPFHLGKTTQVWEIKLYNDQQQLIAISRLTMAIVFHKKEAVV